MNNYTINFLRDLNGERPQYLSYAFHKFADSNTSIYCSDQREYFYDHEDECEEALFSLYGKGGVGELAKEKGLDGLICYAGALGEWDAILNELLEDKNEIEELFDEWEECEGISWDEFLDSKGI